LRAGASVAPELACVVSLSLIVFLTLVVVIDSAILGFDYITSGSAEA
jgi:hypothetical protein